MAATAKSRLSRSVGSSWSEATLTIPALTGAPLHTVASIVVDVDSLFDIGDESLGQLLG